MFDSLSDRLDGVFKKFRGQKRLTEENVQAGLREVRLALLEADVNFKVVKDFVERVKEKALGQDVLKGLDPAQQVVKIVNDELVELLGGQAVELAAPAADEPLKIMMVGLQGSGKTTSSGKISLHLAKEQGKKPYLVPADVYRPAAIDQLTVLAKQLDVPVYPSTTDMNPVDICADALAKAKELGCDLVLFDTAGRLHIDETLMDELASIKAGVQPDEILFVADAMTGQDAVTVAKSFDEKLDISGVVLTKMDGDARGGAALSIKSVTGKQVKFVGVGEKLTELEVFHPDRIASRILGMGDMLTLIEKAEKEFDEGEAEEMGKKMAEARFDFEDFRTQMRRLKKLGSFEGLLKMIPGMGQLTKQLSQVQMPDKEMAKVEAMINSMTKQERRKPELMNDSRKRRIALGSGTTEEDVAKLVTNFEHMRVMMKNMLGGGMPGMPGAGGDKKAAKQAKRAAKAARALPGGRRGMPQLPGMPGGMPNMPGGMPGMDALSGLAGMGGEQADQADNQPKSAFTKKKKKDRKKRKKKK